MFNNKNSKAATHSPKAGIATSLILAALITSGTAIAATGDKVNKVINLSATIPSATFSVNPVFGVWPSDIELQYDEDTNKFVPYTMRIEAKSMVGLTAQLQQAAQLTKGGTTVPLTVKLGNKALTSAPQGIVENDTADQAQTHLLDLSIEQTTAGATYEIAGLYTGVVNMVFEDKF
ncbi:CS1 type fimbrial major subunit (plasmid) [Photobacterium sp. DA100]|uniref:CS1 type fimbrial major subunit n=1 Tax=Photobacterium sp. DA100 TaxID=3027472 RepID=UPI0024786F40|nr:CS1 type fimbrial major subunit [Photobacterium sp. DA100]WEM44707.1 CS1 type fimbrial major subunit [Photobacterium sp. DA100]